MKSSSIRDRRTLADHCEAMFGSRLDLRKWRSRSLLAIGIGAALVTGGASADWKVYDEQVYKQLADEITPRIGNTKSQGGGQGSVTANQKLAYDQLTLGSYKSSGDAVENPQWPAGTSSGSGGGTSSSSGFKVDNFSDMTSATGGGGSSSGGFKLDSNIGRCGGIRDEQKAICEEIVKTENAQFIYMVKFHEMTAERLKRLNEIEQERDGLAQKPENYGKLQDNSNKLLALNTRMELDNAQMMSAMNAYDVRLNYLKAYQAQKTRELQTGKTSGTGSGGLIDIDPTNLGTSLVGGLVLQGALEAQQSSEPPGYKKMGWL